MPEVTLGEIADHVGGKYDGPRDVRVEGLAPLSDATERQISFLSSPRYAEHLPTSRAAAIIVANDLTDQSPRYIRVRNPYFAMASVLTRWFSKKRMPHGLSAMAAISSKAQLGSNVSIGPFTTIGDDVVIGDDVTIFENVSIEAGSSIGDGTVIYPQVSIYEGTRIGRRCIIHSGAVIGADGYGFATEAGRHHKIPQMGIVRIEDDVEVGAGTCVDRAALGETVIGEGTKIDNMVQIGHNAKIGRHCLIVAQVAIAGSAQLGDYVVLAGHAGISGHLKIGTGVQVAAKSAVLEDLPDGAKVMGSPAIPFRDFARREVLLKRLPELVKRVAQLEKKLNER